MLNEIYIDPQILEIVRKIVGYRKSIEKEEMKQSMKGNNENWKDIPCNI